MTATHHAENAIALAAAASIAFSDVSQAAFALGFAAVGGVMGGWAGSIIIPSASGRTSSLRTLTNLCIALPSGPAIGYQATHLYPEIPLYASIMASALVMGLLGVSIFTIILPKLIARFLSKNGTKDQKDGSTD